MEILQGLFGFGAPLGLLALLAIPVVLILYLARPQPEKKEMPSMTFLMEEKDGGKVSQALSKLRSNALLILHLLIPLAIALALANTYIMAESAEGEAVLIYDNSASVSQSTAEIEEFLKSNLREENTVIVSNQEVKTEANNVGPSEAEDIIEDIESTHHESDIASALNLARSYDGDLIVASDLRQSVGEGNPHEILESIDNSGRHVNLYQPSNEFEAVITDYQLENNSIEFRIHSFGALTDRKINYGGQEKSISIEQAGTDLVEFEVEEGQHKADLEGVEDPAGSLPIRVPSEQILSVYYSNEEDSKYLKSASSVDPSLETVRREDAEVFVINDVEGLEEIKIEQILEQPTVIFGSEPSKEFYQSIDQEYIQEENIQIALEDPVELDDHISEAIKSEFGEEISENSDLIRQDGNTVVVGLDPEEVGENPVFPIFTRELKKSVSDSYVSFEDVNKELGDPDLESMTQQKQGFHEIDGSKIAVQQTSVEEFRPIESLELSDEEQESYQPAEHSLINYLVLLGLLMILLDLIYLYNRGEVR